MIKKMLIMLTVFVMLFTFATTVSAATSDDNTIIDAQKISITDANNSFSYTLPLDEAELYLDKIIKKVDYRVFFDEEDKSYTIEFDLQFEDDDNVQVGIREVPGEYDLIYRSNQIFTFRFGNQTVNATKI